MIDENKPNSDFDSFMKDTQKPAHPSMFLRALKFKQLSQDLQAKHPAPAQEKKTTEETIAQKTSAPPPQPEKGEAIISEEPASPSKPEEPLGIVPPVEEPASP
ncbi:MAG: hypothetical protein AABZ60_00205, partial [Planctomycetota bacterium]